MESLLEQEAEFQALSHSYKNVFYQCNVATEKLRSLITILPNFATVHTNFSKEKTNFFLQTMEKYSTDPHNPPLAPGLPGYQEKYLQRILDIVMNISSMSLETSKYITGELSQTIKGLLQQRAVVLSVHNDVVQGAKSDYKSIKKVCKTNYTQLAQLHKELVQMNNKQDKRKMQPTVEKYVQIMRTQKRLIRDLNFAYLTYCRNCQDAVSEFYKLDEVRSQQLLSIFQKLTTLYHKSALSMKQIKIQTVEANQKENETKSWEEGISRYILMNKFARTDLQDIQFEFSSFSFDDNDLEMRVTQQSFVKRRINPLLLALATHDFVPQNENEISLKKGQVVFLYEPAHGKWVLASHDSNAPQGFVPTNAIDVCDVKTAVSCETRLPKDNFMSLCPGEVIILHDLIDKEKRIWYCSKFNGTAGNVHEADIVIE